MDKDKVQRLSQEGNVITTSKDVLKDPYVLEFVGLEDKYNYSETDLRKDWLLIEFGLSFFWNWEKDLLLWQDRKDFHSKKIISEWILFFITDC